MNFGELLAAAATGYVLRETMLRYSQKRAKVRATRPIQEAGLSAFIPREASYYMQYPFNPHLTFVCEGRVTRHMAMRSTKPT